MISDIKNNPENYDAVLIHKTDRFARNREDSIVYKLLVRQDCNVDVISIKEEFGDGPVGQMVEGILESVAEFYSLNLAEEVMKGMVIEVFPLKQGLKYAAERLFFCFL